MSRARSPTGAAWARSTVALLRPLLNATLPTDLERAATLAAALANDLRYRARAARASDAKNDPPTD